MAGLIEICTGVINSFKEYLIVEVDSDYNGIKEKCEDDEVDFEEFRRNYMDFNNWRDF